MARWEPNARERLQHAAMELFEERGYDRTTVSDISARAKLADRTFFRYFSDKREVLFWGSEGLDKLVGDALATVPKMTAPLAVVVAALESASPIFEARRAFARRRHALIIAQPELHERELIKMTNLARALAAGLGERGVAQPTADLLGLTGMILFESAFTRWIVDAKKRDLAHHLRASLAELQRVMAKSKMPKRGREGARKRGGRSP